VQELRCDELTGRWVLLAPNRSARPHTFPKPVAARATTERCPFCPGHEALTPPETFRAGPGAADRPDWRVRVVPNLYPAVGPDGGPGATGAHEVAVLSPAHDRSFGELDDAPAVEVLLVLRDRTRFHLDQGHVYVQTLINHGRAAGASIEHPHAQIVALDVVPPAIAREVDRFGSSGRDLVRDATAAAGALGLDVLTHPAPVWCPEAATTPYEFRAAFDGRASRFDDAGDDEIGAVAVATRDALRGLATVLGDVPYNLVVHSAPRDAGDFHWYLEVQTRLGVVAGFEIGTGILVNTTAPEVAAQRLRVATGSAR
jgi:UDPglucose--hexose-1-phosphate uridylyltransferase